MAGGGFPQRKSTSTSNTAMPGGSASQLDAPPPSPVMSGVNPQAPTQGPMPSFSEMSRPMTAGSPASVTPPEVFVGLMQSMTTIAGMYDSMASMVPELAGDFAMLKDLGQQVMAKLLVKGGQPAAPNSPGLNFPGGGFERGA